MANADCLFKRSSQFYCVYIMNDSLGNYSYYTKINKTFGSYTFKISTILCPASHLASNTFSIILQMPANYLIYDSYGLMSQQQVSSLSSSNLTYVFNEEVMVNSSLLSYKQSNKVYTQKQNIFMVGCLAYLSTIVQLSDIQYQSQWQVATITFTNLNILALHTDSCSFPCALNSQTLTFTNPKYNLTHSKSLSLHNYDLDLQPVNVTFNFTFQFVTFGSSTLNFSLFSSANQSNVEDNFTSTNNSTTGTSYTYEMAYSEQIIYGDEYTTFMQANPMYTLGSCSESTSVINSYNYVYLLFVIISIGILLIFFRRRMYEAQKYGYIVIIILSWASKIIYLTLEQDSSYKLIVVMVFAVEISLNVLYFVQYACIIFTHQQFIKNLNRNSISFVFALIMLFLNYRFYSLLLVRVIVQKKKQVRFRNDHIYIIHLFHLALGIFIGFAYLCYFLLDLYLLSNYLRCVFAFCCIIQMLADVIVAKITFFMMNFKKIKIKIHKILQKSEDKS